MHTPILFITFNRPNHTRRVLEAILASGVQDLYIFQDAPRDDRLDDMEKCAVVREVIVSTRSAISCDVDSRSTHIHGALQKLDYDVLHLHWVNQRFLDLRE